MSDIRVTLAVSDFLADRFPDVPFIIRGSKNDGKVSISWQDSVDAESVVKRLSSIDRPDREQILPNIQITRHFSLYGIKKVVECLVNNYGLKKDDLEIYDVDGDEVSYSLRIKLPELNISFSRGSESHHESEVISGLEKISKVMSIISIND